MNESAIFHYEHTRDIYNNLADETSVALFEGLIAGIRAKADGSSNHVDDDDEEEAVDDIIRTKLMLESLDQND